MSGQNQVVTTFFPTIGGSKCKTIRIGITMTEEKWNQSLSDQESTYFKNLESKILTAVSKSVEIKVAVFKVTYTKACVLNVYFLQKDPSNFGRSLLICSAFNFFFRSLIPCRSFLLKLANVLKGS